MMKGKMILAEAMIIGAGLAALSSCQKTTGLDVFHAKKIVPVEQPTIVNDVANYGFQTDPLPSDFYADVTQYLIPETNTILKSYGIKKGLAIPANAAAKGYMYLLKKYASPIDSMYVQTVFYMKVDPSNFNISSCFVGVDNKNLLSVIPIEVLVTKIDDGVWEVRKTFKVPYSGHYNTVYIGSRFDETPSTSALTLSGFYCKTSRSNPARTKLVITKPN
jgi:hypothetical protein